MPTLFVFERNATAVKFEKVAYNQLVSVVGNPCVLVKISSAPSFYIL